MASIKVKFRPSKNEGKVGVIYYQIIHNRVIRQISTGYKIYSTEWNWAKESIVVPLEDTTRKKRLISIINYIKLDIDRLSNVVFLLNKQYSAYTADDIVKRYNEKLEGQTLFEFMNGVIIRLKELRKIRTSETYRTTLNSFIRFREGEDLLLTDFNSDLMMDYESYLRHRNITMNTVSFYMRILRAVYNRAVEQELIEQTNPFKHVYTGVDKTIKRAMPLKCIKQIKLADFSYDKKLEFAKDMFLFSFYTRGMSFVDMAYLRKKDLNNGILIYRRRKTGKQLFIKWEKCMQDILDKYPPNKTEYLLPIISRTGINERVLYRNVLASINKQLKKISVMLNIGMPMTMYCARHSWASIAKSKNVPISVISEGMGHDSEATTQIYLASLDTAVVDKANRMILRMLI